MLRRLASWAGGFALLAAVPAATTDSYVLNLLILVFYYAYLGQAWNLLGGYAGQLSLGHAAYFGVGAYTSTLLFTQAGLSPWIGMWAGALLAALLALGIGLLGFRFGLRGVYFSLLTLACAEILRVLVLHWEPAGGATGVFLPFRGDAPALYQFKGRVPYYYIALAMLAAATAVVALVVRAPLGWRLTAVREDEEAAEAVGVDTQRAKLAAIALSGALTALGGTFYAQYFFYIHPGIVFAAPLSIEILLRPVVGGAGTIAGPLLGSAILTPLAELSRSALGKAGLEGLHLVLYGALLIATVLFFPRGAVSGLSRLARWLRAKPAATPAGPPPGGPQSGAVPLPGASLGGSAPPGGPASGR